MIKILLVSGHTSGYNKCAATGVNEGDLNIEVVKLLEGRLLPYFDVDHYPYERDMYRDLKAGSAALDMSDYGYVFEVHFNAGGGNGCSIYLHQSYTGGISVENHILENLKNLGIRLRGCQGINRTSSLLNCNTALRKKVDYALIEILFYDNPENMTFYMTHKSDIADAIAEGIKEGFGAQENNDVPPTDEKIRYRVQCGSFSVRENAEKLADELKEKGYPTWVVAARI